MLAYIDKYIINFEGLYVKSKNPTFNHVTPFLFAVLSIVRWCHSDLAKTSDSLHLHSLEWVWMCHRKIPQSLSDHSSDTCINNQGPDDIWWSRWCKALAMESSVVRWWGGKCFTCDQCDAQIPTCLEDLKTTFSCKVANQTFFSAQRSPN